MLFTCAWKAKMENKNNYVGMDNAKECFLLLFYTVHYLSKLSSNVQNYVKYICKYVSLKWPNSYNNYAFIRYFILREKEGRFIDPKKHL